MMKNHLLLIALLISVQLSASTAGIQFESLNTMDGLSQNTVTSILQDQYGFLWFGTRDGLSWYDGHFFRTFKNTHLPGNPFPDNYVRALSLGNDNTIWIGAGGGVFRFSYAEDRVVRLPLPLSDDGSSPSPIECIETADDGDVLIMTRDKIYVVKAGTDEIILLYSSSDVVLRKIISVNDRIYFSGNDGGIRYTDDEFETIYYVLDSEGGKIFGDDQITFILPRPDGSLFVGMKRSGVGYIDPRTQVYRKLALGDESLGDVYVRSILQNGESELWIGTESGLFIYDLMSGSSQHLKSSYYDDKSLSDNAIYSLFKDYCGGIWVGTFFGGLNYLSPYGKVISNYYPTGETGSIKGKRVRDIVPDDNGCFWVGTEDAGLYHFNPRTSEFKFFEPSQEFTNIHDLQMIGSDLWVCTFGRGIKVIDTMTGRMRSYTTDDGRSNVGSDFIFSLAQADDGKLYVGAIHSLMWYDRDKDRFEQVSDVRPDSFIRDLFLDSSGNMWASSEMSGIYRKGRGENVWQLFVHDTANPNSIPSNNVSEIFEDSRHTLWFTTEGDGLFRYANGSFETYNTSDGLPSDVVCKILEDDHGYLWISTLGGLALFDPVKGKVLDVFTHEDGLLNDQFNNKSGYKDQNGRLWFGTISGLISFMPNELANLKSHGEPPVLISGLYIYDEHVSAGYDGSPLEKGIIETKSLRLSSRQNNISLELVTPLHSHRGSDFQIVYMMDGHDKDWRTLSANERRVNYSRLSPGRYVFRAKTLNATEPTSSLMIRVLPPWYRSLMAYVIYFIVLNSILLIIAKAILENRKRKEAISRNQYEIEKAKELYDSKINFYTNIAHEIRTPLTLIKGPLEHLLKVQMPADAKEDLDIMDKNSTRLLDLVDELLNFNKIEGKGIHLDFAETNFSDLISNTVYQFSSVAKQTGKSISLNIADQPFTAILDAEAVTKVFSNLLSNALKYSESIVDVSLEKTEDSFRLRIFNDGASIPNEYREKVFEPFFRVDENSPAIGSGVGLPYARSLARMHGGDVVLEDSKTGTSFCVILPCRQPALEISSSPEGTDGNHSEKSRTILIVEDNSDMMSFEERILIKDYAVLSARNGAEALEILQSKVVDMIISDVMMPEMDGVELCRRVKDNLMFSHIPVVLLTAKASTEAKIEGADAGAESYIEKPFSPEYLTSVICNIFNTREKLMERVQKYPLSPIGNISTSNADNELIARIHDIIMENLTNPSFSIDDIAYELAMSRSSFYRKIKGVLNMGPNEYLRLERLKEAAKLIREHKYSLTEISYKVGFNSPSYFSKCFQKQFGIHPKDF